MESGVALVMWLLTALTGCLAFSILTLVVVVHNRSHFQPLESAQTLTKAVSVSVLIPARNEVDRIERCLQSVLQQRGVDDEVWVLDDRSTDATAAIVSSYARRHPHLRLHAGESLPAGWLGKPWACQQLSELAAGDYLLFLDADVELAPGALAAALAMAQRDRLGLLSLLPVQVMGSLVERLLIPIIPWSLLSLLPLGWAQRVRWPLLSAAIGQFMLFHRQAYQAVGGHQQVRHSVTEDLLLARRIKAAGLRWALRSGRGAAHCRMYVGGHQTIAGLSRSLLGVFDGRVGLHLALWSWIAAVNLLPVGVLAAALGGASLPEGAVWRSAASVILNVGAWLMIRHMAGLPLAAGFNYPLTLAFGWAIAVRSAFVSDRMALRWRTASGSSEAAAR